MVNIITAYGDGTSPFLICPWHGISKYGIHSLMQIALAMDKELTNWQDSAPDWLSKSSRQLVICSWLVAQTGMSDTSH